MKKGKIIRVDFKGFLDCARVYGEYLGKDQFENLKIKIKYRFGKAVPRYKRMGFFGEFLNIILEEKSGKYMWVQDNFMEWKVNSGDEFQFRIENSEKIEQLKDYSEAEKFTKKEAEKRNEEGFTRFYYW